MSYELISEDEYASLPEEDDKCFVAFENICRRNMTRMIDENTSSHFDSSVREQYMVHVSKVAEACHILHVAYDPTEGGDFNIVFAQFCLAVQGEVARIRILSRGERHPYSVLLTSNTRTKIEHYISRIREIVDKSDMDSDRKWRLQDKLDELARELMTERLSFAKTMAILATVTTMIAGVVTISADGPSAITHIMALIGHDKESEDAAAKRLAPPPKALPAPVQKPKAASPPSGRKSLSDMLDDDIPF